MCPARRAMQSLIDPARKSGQQASGILYLTARREDSVNATAIPLKNSAGEVLAVLIGGDFARRHGGGAAAHSRDCLWRGERRNSAGDRLQLVDCGAGVAAD